MESVTQYTVTHPGQLVFVAAPPLKKEWIIIELVDDEGQPVEGENYEVTLPDGTVREGTLDDKGCVRLEGIPEAGDCRITFPDLDGAAWERID